MCMQEYLLAKINIHVQAIKTPEIMVSCQSWPEAESIAA